MPCYFFDTQDGETDVDDSGLELTGDDAAIGEAIRYAGALIGDQPALIQREHPFVVSARNDEGAVIARVRIELVRD